MTSQRRKGVTLVELVVTMAIISILAAVAMPYAQKSVQRQREIELRRSLREIRTAIDRFHDDWRQGLISRTSDDVSEDGYPKRLAVLVNGVERAGNAKGPAPADQQQSRQRYLRRIPRDPMAVTGAAGGWLIRGYRDDTEAVVWKAADVYDVHSTAEGVGSDGAAYRTW